MTTTTREYARCGDKYTCMPVSQTSIHENGLKNNNFNYQIVCISLCTASLLSDSESMQKKRNKNQNFFKYQKCIFFKTSRNGLPRGHTEIKSLCIIHAKSYGFAASLTNFLIFYSLTGIGHISYGYDRFFDFLFFIVF